MKITIITVCLNSEKTIERTIKSVLNQSYKNIEYIIWDGDSKDRTKKIVKKYLNDPRIVFISKKDKGPGDAFLELLQ
jgi:glycosyltransferase involved in cell wall biosynthesis